MSELIRAILDGNVKQVRLLAKEKPDLLRVCSSVGTTPLRVALDKGQVDIQVALIRANAPGSEVIGDFSALLIDYIRELSYYFACAGWLSQIEYFLWQVAILNVPVSEDVFCMGELDEDRKEDLRFLAERSGGWAAYLEKGPAPITQDEWLTMFRNWR